MNIHDDILALRALEPTDLDVLYRWENNEELWHTSATITPYSRKQLWDYIENYDGDIFKSRQLRLIIEEIATKEVVGTIDLYDIDPINRRAYVGILIDPSCQGRGYGAISLQILESYVKRYIGLHQLIAIVATTNYNSLKLFEKSNYKKAGKLIDWLNINGEYCDANLYQKVIL